MVTDNPSRLNGEVALITGSGTGLELGMARCMLTAGVHVVLIERREGQLASACSELGSLAICGA